MNLLKLYKVEFDKNHEDVIGFKTRAEQADYFKSKESASFLWEDLTIVKDSDLSNIRLKGNYNILQTVNYAYFENEIDGVTRGYYAFVDRVGYVSQDTVSISLSVDAWQTYLFEHTLQPSFIERGHVRRWNQDGTADLTYCRTPENVQVGNTYRVYKESDFVEDNAQGDKWENGTKLLYYVVLYRDNQNTPVELQSRSADFPIIQPLQCVILPFPAIESDSTSWQGGLELADLKGNHGTAMGFGWAQNYFSKQPWVISCKIVGDTPLTCRYSGGVYTAENGIAFSVTLDGKSGYMYSLSSPSGQSGLYGDYLEFIMTHTDKFIDKELKCNCSPYNEYYLMQQRTNEYTIKPEYLVKNNFTKNGDGYSLTFDCVRSVSLGYDIKQIYYCPDMANYSLSSTENTSVNSDMDSLMVTDNYLQYLATSKASMKAGLQSMLFSTATSIAGSAVTGNPFGLVTSVAQGTLGIAQHYAKIDDLKNQPNELKKGGNDVYLEAINRTIQTTLYNRRIVDSEMNRLKRYFNLYGYTVKDYLDFDLNSRKYFNYVQTVDCRVTGDINEEHIEALQTRYNNGIRIWHYNPNDWHGIGAYTLDNEEVYT